VRHFFRIAFPPTCETVARRKSPIAHRLEGNHPATLSLPCNYRPRMTPAHAATASLAARGIRIVPRARPRRAGSCSSFPLAHAPSRVLDTAPIHCGGARFRGRKLCHRPASSISAQVAAIVQELTRPASSRTSVIAAPRHRLS
jgi:hypothetical protein